MPDTPPSGTINITVEPIDGEDPDQPSILFSVEGTLTAEDVLMALFSAATDVASTAVKWVLDKDPNSPEVNEARLIQFQLTMSETLIKVIEALNQFLVDIDTTPEDKS